VWILAWQANCHKQFVIPGRIWFFQDKKISCNNWSKEKKIPATLLHFQAGKFTFVYLISLELVPLSL